MTSIIVFPSLKFFLWILTFKDHIPMILTPRKNLYTYNVKADLSSMASVWEYIK